MDAGKGSYGICRVIPEHPLLTVAVVPEELWRRAPMGRHRFWKSRRERLSGMALSEDRFLRSLLPQRGFGY